MHWLSLPGLTRKLPGSWLKSGNTRAKQPQKSRQKMKAAAEAGDPDGIRRYEAYLAKRREDYHKKNQSKEEISA